ncbi:hypothetical protein [Frigoriflavimonas asaccharolytica]|uniref:Uncharacterized protein n=1 Tax=Frigoriflavimonas asaccharolytica TaxID=2735899 RepID=A0A8J8G592_9FLAO|nr:hypothetical protein [Frigoriflavimonas asaccharolytica]NRS91311.1 hypothetical protein [Frigoriflavimonas asaccharolytica]
MSKFTVPKPCHENWENMLPEEKGKFCGFCQKTVYDFTQTSDEKIQQIFEKENGNICGRFENTQLIQFSKFQNVVMRFENFTKNHFSKFGILVSAVSLLMSISGCQKKIETIGELAPAKMNGDSANCTTDSLNSQIELGEPMMIREDTAQIQIAKRIPLSPKIIESSKHPDYPEHFVTGEPVFIQDSSKIKKPPKPPKPAKLKLPGYPHTVGMPIAVDSTKNSD